MKATLIIVNHNGRDLLVKSVPAALEAASQAGGHPVVVADDASTDDSVHFVSTSFPDVSVLPLAKRGFGPTCNDAVAAAKTDLTVLLNSDVVVSPDFLPPLLADLEAEDVFAVGCKFLNPDGSLTHVLGNRTSGEWRGGLLQLHHETDPERLRETCPQLYPMGGAMAFRRRMWQALGGFDPLYHPFYWEDADLGYCAWRRGWRVLFEPASVVYHDQGGTIGRFYRPAHIELISARNALLFAWKNLLDPRPFSRTLLAQARWTTDDILIGGLPNRAGALWRAFLQLGQAARARAREQQGSIIPDSEIIARSSGDPA